MPGMAYLVRAETRIDGEHVTWLAPSRLDSSWTFAPKEMAERFQSEASALAAIDMMRVKEVCRDITFALELAD